MKKKPADLDKLVETIREENTPQDYPEEPRICCVCGDPKNRYAVTIAMSDIEPEAEKRRLCASCIIKLIDEILENRKLKPIKTS